MNDKIKDIVVTLVFLFTIISLFLINVIKKNLMYRGVYSVR